ncbi:hypothetical protein J6590_088242 [Homalodisca vitripennis]|nr:hypothetical protein J6590_088242 [Homalodisca vitripennis]
MITLSVLDDCRTVGPHLILTRVADVTFLQGRTFFYLHLFFILVSDASTTFAQRTAKACEYDDPLSTPRQKKPMSRTVGPRPGPWTLCPPTWAMTTNQAKLGDVTFIDSVKASNKVVLTILISELKFYGILDPLQHLDR